MYSVFPAKLINNENRKAVVERGPQDPLLRGTLRGDPSAVAQHVVTYDSTAAVGNTPSNEDIMSSLLTSSDSTISVNSNDCILSSESRSNAITAGSPNIQVEINSAMGLKHRALSRSQEVRDLWKIFLSGLNPINTEEWSDLGLHWKIYEVFKVGQNSCSALTRKRTEYPIVATHRYI